MKLKTFQKKPLEALFKTSWDEIFGLFDDPKKTVSFESVLNCADGTTKEIVISASRINYSSEDGYIIIAKEVSRRKIFEQETEKLSSELQTSLLLMNQPIRHFVKDLITCNSNTSIHEAADLLTRKNEQVVFYQTK